MAGTSNGSVLLDEVYQCAKNTIEQLATEEQKKLDSLNAELEEERARADRFKKLYEHEKANIKSLQNRVTELDRALKSVATGTNGISPRLANGDSTDQSCAKLGEECAELYDNWWKEAFNFLTTKKKRDEKTAIIHLQEIITGAFTFCHEISIHQLSALKTAILYPATVTNMTTKPPSNLELPALQSAAIKDVRMECADLSVEDIKTSFSKKHPDLYDKDQPVRMYADKCLELCWNMGLQDPSVAMDTDTKQGDNLNTNDYKIYSKSGKKVEYLVWPAIYTCKGGALLRQGIAQVK